MEDLIHGLGRLEGMGYYKKMMIRPLRRQMLFRLQGNKSGGWTSTKDQANSFQLETLMKC